MRQIDESKALVQLRRTKQHFSDYIARKYAFKAYDCAKCTTVCCADSQFVNVNITRLEAVAILRTLKNSPRIGSEKVAEILKKAEKAIEKYHLAKHRDTFSQTYACPLFESGKGCLVHWKAKPAPCIQHGCYENWQDLPDELELRRVEQRIARLNESVYQSDQQNWSYATIPVWLIEIAKEMQQDSETSNEVDELNELVVLESK
ncbi:MAG: hypothetical protein JNN15_17170 [Blastocatellia bacterium]|nr:hypothetical protein [Blastocatellia bacterium]